MIGQRQVARLRVASALVGVIALAGFGVGCGTHDSGARATDDSTGAASTSAAPTDPTSSAPGDGATSAPAIPPGTPTCGDVWIPGKRLPRGYQACVAGGELVKPEVLGCSSGQALIVHEYRYWAVRGGTIQRAHGGIPADRNYRKDMRACRA